MKNGLSVIPHLLILCVVLPLMKGITCLPPASLHFLFLLTACTPSMSLTSERLLSRATLWQNNKERRVNSLTTSTRSRREPGTQNNPRGDAWHSGDAWPSEVMPGVGPQATTPGDMALDVVNCAIEECDPNCLCEKIGARATRARAREKHSAVTVQLECTVFRTPDNLNTCVLMYSYNAPSSECRQLQTCVLILPPPARSPRRTAFVAFPSSF